MRRGQTDAMTVVVATAAMLVMTVSVADGRMDSSAVLSDDEAAREHSHWHHHSDARHATLIEAAASAPANADLGLLQLVCLE